ncbi:uncharacterized protein LOC100194062 [Zea mays]|uniref:Uncharacterized protein n=1 Tax=Zea mays TaxID=4577 RepID=B4FHB2_MAIZE|nr:uncharacterized protein LOC100194062 [Zea mays]ACF81505.1 unknown [Zea mays]|eukprot:NP_001132590.1 uncharacterized protein LOC100194062 [Zea mays]
MQPPSMVENGSFNAFNRPPRLNSPLRDSLLLPAIKRACQSSFPKPQHSISALLLAHACTASIIVFCTPRALLPLLTAHTQQSCCHSRSLACSSSASVHSAKTRPIAPCRSSALRCWCSFLCFPAAPSAVADLDAVLPLSCSTLLREADCVVEDPNSCEDDPQDTFEQEGDAGDFDGDFIDDEF